ncbi:hypothetical protein [Pelagibacter phage HTVC010P]|uniref:hypothetical protein n=1 Tax=Pelagibacter phage HTVC010P TaxID=1283077 RepID=UPI0002B2684E|nr:hypothetical protein I900_gp58 [Pelagibacter phage HTVC010P]AGE60328.1 hypothetical protein [Pelagibacter phage HTVC010P]
MTKSKSISSKKKNELTLNDTEQNTILATIYDGGIPHIVIKDTLKISLMSFYKYLDLNPKFKEEFLKAQEVGIKTLVEKMLAIFQSDTNEMSNEELLFLREKQNYIKWLAPRISSLFTEKQKIDVKSDSVVKISWEDNQDNLIDISGDITDIPPDNKD